MVRFSGIPRAYGEVWERFVDGVQHVAKPAHVGAVVAFAILFVLFPRRRLERFVGPKTRFAVLAVLSSLALFASLYIAWDLKWLSDDGFISFRYAENLARGHGLVFNPGERVEGYTNFLWTVVIAAGIKLGLDAGQFALVFGMVCFAAALIVSQRLVLRLEPPGAKAAIPIAGILLGLNYTFASFATSGLETMFAALLTIWAVERATAKSPMAAGFLGIAAVMSHPDHAVLYVALAACLLLDPEQRKTAWRYAVPFVAVYLPYFVWRWAYYGDLFPNTYYAKSGGDLYFSQGGIYLYISLFAGGFWGILPLAFVGGIAHHRSLLSRFTLIGLPLYLVYVAKIGGDFMLGRLLCTALPPVCILAELGARALVDAKRAVVLARIAAVLGVVLSAAAIARIEIVRPGEKFWHVADERTFYGISSFKPLRVASPMTGISDTLKRHFVNAGQTPTIALGCVGIIGYETKLPLVDTFGLTDRYVAHTKIAKRGRPGHEKTAPPSYVFGKGADLWDRGFFPEMYNSYSRVRLDGNEFFLSHHDPKIYEALKRRHVAPASVTQFLDTYAADPSPRTPDAALCDLWFFEDFYFRSNADPARRQAILSRMNTLDVFPAGAEPFFAIPRGESPKGFKRKLVFGFDEPRTTFRISGRALDEFPTLWVPPPQDAPLGVNGAFVDTWHSELMDLATGELETPEFTLDGDYLTFNLGGGRDPVRLQVNLKVRGSVVASFTGCYTEITNHRIVDLRRFKGQKATLHIVDASDGGWGHLIVDDVALWTRE